MMHCRLYFFVTCALISWISERAQAQGMVVVVTEINGVNPENDPKKRMGPAGCERHVNLRITGIDTTKTVLDFWRGDGCEAPEARGGANKKCDNLPNASVTIVGRSEIFYNDDGSNKVIFGKDLVPGCTTTPIESYEGIKPIYILATDSVGSTATVNNWGRFDIYFDTKPPDAPTNVEGGSGESQIGVSWQSSILNQTVDNTGFRIYVDGSAGCSSTVLVPGCPAVTANAVTIPEGCPDSSFVHISEASVASSSGTVDPANAGLSIGTEASVAVTAVDKVGNESLLSTLGCIRVIETTGFFENYRNAGGSASSGAGCSVNPQAHQTSGVWLFLLMGLLLKRRRSH